jgi:hypothetical protein
MLSFSFGSPSRPTKGDQRRGQLLAMKELIIRLFCLVGLLLSALLVASCASGLWSTPPADPALSSGVPPTVYLEDPIGLSEQRVRLLKAAAGTDLAIHILLLPQSGDKPRYLIVRAGKLFDGEMPPAVLKSGEVLDAFVDRQGALHAIVGKHHYELGPAGWREIEGPGCRSFVTGGPNVACLFVLAAPDPRNRTRWDWFGFGGFGVGIILPWHIHATKLGLAEYTSSGWVERGIVDRASSWDTLYADADASSEGDIEVVYRRGVYQFVDVSQLRYERFNAPGRESAPAPTERIEALGADDASWSLLGVSVDEFKALLARTAPGRFWGNPRIASDRVGRESIVLMVDNNGTVWMRRIVYGLPEAARMLLDEKGSRRVRGLVALDEGRMVALLEESRTGWWSIPPQPLRLVEYRDGKWSAPIEVGATSHINQSSLLAVSTDSVAVIGADSEGRPFIRLVKFIP